MAVTVVIQCGLSGTRDISSGVDNYSRVSVSPQTGGSTALTASTTPDAENIVTPQIALVAGAYTLDLTALPDVNGATTTLTGKKPRALFFENLGAANMTFAKGASNGLDTLSGAWTLTLYPGERRCIDLHNVSVATIPAIDATHKVIDVTGTTTDEFNFGVIVG